MAYAAASETKKSRLARETMEREAVGLIKREEEAAVEATRVANVWQRWEAIIVRARRVQAVADVQNDVKDFLESVPPLRLDSLIPIYDQSSWGTAKPLETIRGTELDQCVDPWATSSRADPADTPSNASASEAKGEERRPRHNTRHKTHTTPGQSNS